MKVTVNVKVKGKVSVKIQMEMLMKTSHFQVLRFEFTDLSLCQVTF